MYYVAFYTENEADANKLYNEMLIVCRENFCDVLNKLSIKDFIDWVQNTFNLQRKEEKVPLIMVKCGYENQGKKVMILLT